MKFTWHAEEKPDGPAPGLGGRVVAVPRILALVACLTTGVLATALLRLVEAPLYGQNRPWTPFITQWVCRSVFLILNMRFKTRGEILHGAGAVVANHSSWLDIFALNARTRLYFVSKSEVASWPGIGLLAKITGTLFIRRDPKEARAQTALFEARLGAGHKLLFFPEGTSTDGVRVLPFKTTLFQAFFNVELRDWMQVQPVTVIYRAPPGQDARFYGWWGDMGFASHVLQVLATWRQGAVEVVYHPPVKVADFPDRKALAAHLEAQVRAGMPEARQRAG